MAAVSRLIAAVLVGCLGTVSGALPIGAVPAAGEVASGASHGALMAFGVQQESVDQKVAAATRGLLREIRQSFWVLRWVFAKAFAWWKRWFRRAAFYLAVAVVAALADSGLLGAWRSEGGRVLTTYVPLMLYVYARLFFAAGVRLLPKVLLVVAIAYGVFRRDLIPDRTVLPGRLEDIVFIAVATRFFVYACPDDLVDEYAARAITLKRRIATSQRARPR